jgi:hypothetical protein
MSGVKESNEKNGGRTVFRGYRMTDHKRKEDLLGNEWE